MSLQGSLDTFALPDVLVLLATTKKSGELHVAGARTAATPRANDVQGLLWVVDGQLVGFDVPRASEAAEAVFELLRLESGSFSFMAGTPAPSPQAALEIEPVLADAQGQLAEWREIELVVPTLAAWLELAPEPPAAHVSMRAEQWRLVVAVGGGCSVNAVVDRLGGSELVGCRAVKELIEAGLVELTQAPEPVSAAMPVIESPVMEAPVIEAPTPVAESVDTVAGGWLSPIRDDAVFSSGDDAGDPPDETDEISKAVAAATAEAVASMVHPDAEPEGHSLPTGQTLEDFDSLVTLPPKTRKGRSASESAESGVDAKPSKRAYPEKRTLGAFLDEKAGTLSEAQALSRQVASLGGEPGAEPAAEFAEAGPEAVTVDDPETGAEPAGDGDVEGAEDEPLNRGLLLKFLSSVRN